MNKEKYGEWWIKRYFYIIEADKKVLIGFLCINVILLSVFRLGKKMDTEYYDKMSHKRYYLFVDRLWFFRGCSLLVIDDILLILLTFCGLIPSWWWLGIILWLNILFKHVWFALFQSLLPRYFHKTTNQKPQIFFTFPQKNGLY